MFFQNFKYTFKALIGNKSLVFWTLAFPLILGLFFNMAFSNIENEEKFDAIDIAIVSNESYENSEMLKQTFEYLSNEDNDDRVFNTKYVSEDEASQLLNDNNIDGYVIFTDENPQIVINKNGINQTIFKFVVEEVVQSEDTAEVIQEKVQEVINNRASVGFFGTIKLIFGIMQNNSANLNDITENNLSYMTIEYYTLIAMSCLYGGILGAVAINWCLANMSNVGKRLSMTPVSKLKLVFSGAIASYIIQLIGLALLFAFTIFVLKVDYGNKMPQMVLLSIVGSFAGLSMGIAVTTVFKANENLKTGILLGFTMLGCFFSGMMGVGTKYIIDKNVPIINKLNPANMITDGFYALYYYDTLDRFYFNVICLCIFSAIMLAIAILSLRKQKYESI